MSDRSRDRHRCPGGCGEQVPDRFFACAQDWARLPEDLQRAIKVTARLTLVRQQRFDAVQAAQEWYQENPR